MAASRIKGITVEIGGDTTGLDTALKGVNQRSQDLQKELRDVERLLKFNPNNVELLAQKQELLTQRIQATTEKLDQLRAAESQVQAQFERGEIGEAQYRAFRRELEATEGSLNGLRNQLSNMQQEQENVASSTRHLETLFQATGTSVDDFANSLGTRLTNAIRNGTATSAQLEEAIQRIGREALGTDIDLDRMRQSLRNIDNGSSLDQVRQDLNQLSQEANEAEGSINELGGELTNLAAGLAAGGGIASTIEKALDMSSLNTKIDITFDVPEESKESVRSAVKGIQAYGVDAEAALEGVRRQWALNKDATDAQNDTIVRGAAAISTAFAGVDFTELIQETNEIGAALQISNHDALALVDSLLKAGFPPEQLDTIAEYGQQMKDAGFSAQEVQAIFEAGIDTKTWNIDNLNDGVKEARIQMATFGLEVDENLGKLVEKSGISSKQFQDWGKAVAAGGQEGSKAMSEVVTWLDSIDNKELKNELATKVFGTKWEDQGQNMIAVFNGVADAADKTTENTNGLYETMGKVNADPAVQLQQALTNMNTALQPVLTSIADLVTKIATWVSENPKLAATITAIVTGLGIFIGIIMGLIPIIGAMSAGAAALGIGLMPLIGIVAGVVAGIAALIAIGILLYKNWDEIKAKAIETWGVIKDWFAETWEAIKTKTAEIWMGLKAWLSNTWNSIKETATNVWTSIKNFFSDTWNNIKQKTSEVWNAIKSFFSDTWNGIKNTFNTIISTIVDFVQEKWDNIKTNTSTIFNAIKSKITEIWNGIKTWLSETVEGIKNTVRDKFENLKSAVQEKMTGAKDKIIEIWNTAKSFLQNINLLQIGKDIIQGLIDGIADKAKALYDKAREIANTVKDFFTGLFDINSPSRWMRDMIGKNMMQGWIDGIKSMEAKVLAVSSDMGELMKPTSPSDFGYPQHINNSRNYQPSTTIIVQSPNPSPSEIARKNLQIQRQLGMEWGY